MKKLITTTIITTILFGSAVMIAQNAGANNAGANNSRGYNSGANNANQGTLKPQKYCSANIALTENEVIKAQQKWAENIIAIGKSSNPKPQAKKAIDELYGFDRGKVLFKPTLASVDQFRGDKQEALSYFVGGENKEDAGFALCQFTDIKFENEAIITNCDTAIAMGNYFFTTIKGEKMKVEYSFAYQKTAPNEVKIILHHSSLPYLPVAPIAQPVAQPVAQPAKPQPSNQLVQPAKQS